MKNKTITNAWLISSVVERRPQMQNRKSVVQFHYEPNFFLPHFEAAKNAGYRNIPPKTQRDPWNYYSSCLFSSTYKEMLPTRSSLLTQYYAITCILLIL